jgi:protein TonB
MYLDGERVLEFRETSGTYVLEPGCDQAFDRQAIQVAFAWATDLGGDYLTSVTDAIRRPTAFEKDRVASEEAEMSDSVSWPSLSELTKPPEAVIVETPPSAAPFTSTSIDRVAPSSTGSDTRITIPRYPVTARLRRQEGRVILLLDVSPSGRVDEASVSETSGFPALDKAAANEARREWRLVPGLEGGVPTRMNKEATVTFRIGDKSVDVQIE